MKALLLSIMLAHAALSAPLVGPSPTPSPIQIEGVFTGEEKWIDGEIYRAFRLADGTILWLKRVDR